MNCLDKKKFSGQGRKKQCCVERKCKNLTDRLLPPDKAQPLDGEFQQEVDDTAPGIIHTQVCTTCNVSHIDYNTRISSYCEFG